MNADEIVKALHICNNPRGHRCSECPVFSKYEHRICKKNVDKCAADLIESLQAELAEYKNTGLTSKDIQKIATAKSEGRLIIRPFTWKEIRKQVG